METNTPHFTAIVVLIWTALASAQIPFLHQRLPFISPQYRSVAHYPFSRIAGVFRVVDEDSCRCVPSSRRCAVEIMEESVTKARWFPCPFMTKYCCRREEVFDRSDAEEIKHQNRNLTESGISRTNPSHVNAPNDRIYIENSHSNLIQVVPQSPDNQPLTIPNVSDASVIPGTTNFSRISNTSEVSSVLVASKTLPSKKTWRDSDSQTCKCTTRDQCLAWWSELDEPPEVKVKTNLQCEVPGQVTCCFGRIVPPHLYKAHEPSSSENAALHSFKTPRWRPFATIWGSGI
ncbi:uncharacterized protein LOC134785186 [Penaeus indicus]|uniref:uncharacterized protein LOC134785186 n=1 Tax=Penaeus indicus TaxID=29960 RepID=UPI00300D6647